MSWIFLTLLSVNLYSVSDVFDKYFISNKYKSFYTFAVAINIAYLIFYSITALFIRNTFILNWGLFWTFTASMMYFLMWIFWWKALTTGEVSRVIAIFFTSPVINAILAIIFLKETISVIKWLAIIFIVAGAIMSTWESTSTKKSFNKAYIYALLAALSLSVGNVLSKKAMVYWQPLAVQVFGALIAMPLYLLFLFKKQVYREVKKTFIDLRATSLLILRGFIGFLAACSFTLALGAGPISLVVALNGGQPMIILIYSTIITVFWPKIIKEEISKGNLFYKTMAVILIVVGSVIISL